MKKSTLKLRLTIKILMVLVLSLSFITNISATHKNNEMFDVGMLSRSNGKLNNEILKCKSTPTDSQGRRYVAGYIMNDQGYRDFAIARILLNGLLDNTFGNNGGKKFIDPNDKNRNGILTIPSGRDLEGAQEMTLAIEVLVDDTVKIAGHNKTKNNEREISLVLNK